jgi:hypothetical protein
MYYFVIWFCYQIAPLPISWLVQNSTRIELGSSTRIKGIKLVEVLIGAQTIRIVGSSWAETLVGQIASIQGLIGAIPVGYAVVAVIRLPTRITNAEIFLPSIAFSTDTMYATRA